jgi:soluble lytic murein transglycosylase
LAGLPFDEHRYRNDRDYNLALGSAYLEAKIKEFGGDEEKGIAAYNTGAANVRKAMQTAAKYGAPHKWLDHLSEETRKYVPKVLRNADSMQRGDKMSDASAYEDAWNNDKYDVASNADDEDNTQQDQA